MVWAIKRYFTTLKCKEMKESLKDYEVSGKKSLTYQGTIKNMTNDNHMDQLMKYKWSLKGQHIILTIQGLGPYSHLVPIQTLSFLHIRN